MFSRLSVGVEYFLSIYHSRISIGILKVGAHEGKMLKQSYPYLPVVTEAASSFAISHSFTRLLAVMYIAPFCLDCIHFFQMAHVSPDYQRNVSILRE